MDAWTQDTNGVPGFMGQAHKISSHWALSSGRIPILRFWDLYFVLILFCATLPTLLSPAPPLIELSDAMRLRPRMYRPLTFFRNPTSSGWCDDAMSKGCFVQGRCRPRDALSNWRIIWDFLFGEVTAIRYTLETQVTPIAPPSFAHLTRPWAASSMPGLQPRQFRPNPTQQNVSPPSQ